MASASISSSSRRERIITGKRGKKEEVETFFGFVSCFDDLFDATCGKMFLLEIKWGADFDEGFQAIRQALIRIRFYWEVR
jgi:hypothetical protein